MEPPIKISEVLWATSDEEADKPLCTVSAHLADGLFLQKAVFSYLKTQGARIKANDWTCSTQIKGY